MLLVRTLCVVMLCILTLCAIFNLSIFVYINAIFVLYQRVYQREIIFVSQSLIIHLFEPEVITTGDEVGIMARTSYVTLQEFQSDVELIKAYLERANSFSRRTVSPQASASIYC